jgi:hypothetical protein
MKRVLLAGVLGGVVVFAWSAFSHMVLPLGEMGIRTLPNEEPVLSALRSSVPEAGLYFFPGMDPNEQSKEAQEVWAEKYRSGPAGLLVYHPIGGEALQLRQFLLELFSNMLAALLAAFVIVRTKTSLFGRAFLVAGLGLFAWLSITVSYWNWDGFPSSFVMAEGIDQVVGWFLGGLAVGRIAVPREA